MLQIEKTFFPSNERPNSILNNNSKQQADKPNELMQKILVVEDNILNQKVMSLFLRELGYYKVDIANSGMKALDFINRQRYSLILLDIGLPDIDGFEVARYISKIASFNDVPIIAVTAHLNHAALLRYSETIIDDYLIKPVNIDELKKKITFWLNKKVI